MEYREDLLRKLELAFRIVRKQLIKAREYQKKYYDKKAKLQGFTIGDKEYLHNTANKIGISPKLTKLNWKGPFRVLEKKSDLTYRIRHCATLREEVVNVNRLKLAVERILPTLGEYDPKGEKEETTVKGNGESWVEEDREEETLTDSGGVESGSLSLDGSREVEGQGTVELAGERLEFSSPDTIVSPRKPQRTVDRAIAILDKALQGVPCEERDKTLNLLEWDWQEEVGQTPEPQMEQEGQGMGNVRRQKQRRKKEIKVRRKQEKRSRMGPGTQWKQNRKRWRRRKEITRWKEKISEDEVPPVQKRTRGGGRVIRRPDFFQAGGK